MSTEPSANVKILPDPTNSVYRDVFVRPKRRAKANFVQLPVAVIPKLRRLGVGPFCAYAAIAFQSAVQRRSEVTVPARTWLRFGCRADNRYKHVKKLVKAGLVESVAGPPGKPLKLRLTTFSSAKAPPST